MSVAVVGTPAGGVFASGTGVNYTAGAGSNRIVLLGLAHTSSAGVAPTVYSAPTFGGTALTEVGSFIVNSTARFWVASLWLLKEASIPSGSQAVVASWSTGSNNLNEGNALSTLWTLSGVNQTTPVSATDSGTTNSATSVAGSGLSATGGGLVAYVCSYGVDSTGTVPSGYTEASRNNFDFVGQASMGHKTISSAGTETPSFSWTGTAGAVILTANIQQSVAGTTITPSAGGASTTGNTPTVTPAQNTVIQTFVARHGSPLLEPDRRLIVPQRKIFLPLRKAA